MAISGIGPTPEPQKNTSQSVNEQEEKVYSIFDNAPQDGVVSTEEQEVTFLSKINEDKSLIKDCNKFKINITEFCKNFARNFGDLKTGNTKDEVADANQIIEIRIAKCKIELQKAVLEKYNEEKKPPSVTTKEGLQSEECINYLLDKIENMGLELDQEKLISVLVNYDYIHGDDSYISQDEIRNDYSLKFMNHDSEGNVKDTHVLDYLINLYKEELIYD